MNRDKYMGLDVHQATTVVAVMNVEGKVVLETMVPTKAGPIRELIESLSGPLHVTLEEGTQAEWLHEVISRLGEGSRGVRSEAEQTADGRLEGRQARCTETGGSVTGRNAAIGLARA